MTRAHTFSIASQPVVLVTGGADVLLQEALAAVKTKVARGFEAEARFSLTRKRPTGSANSKMKSPESHHLTQRT